MNYKSSAHLFSVIKQDLSSYDANNLIDEGSFYREVKHIINRLGMYAYDNSQAMIRIGDTYKVPLPNDFGFLDSAFKCSGESGGSEDVWNEQLGNVIKMETECSILRECNECEITCCGDKEFNKIKTRIFVKGVPLTNNYSNPILLRLGNVNKDKDKCAGGCPCITSNSPFTISMDNNFIYTNFKNAYIYLNYYAFPLDENGLPEIPDDTEVEQAIEYAIKARIFENLWTNGDDPNVEKKFQFYNMKADEKFRAAKYKAALPTFLDSVQMIRRNARKASVYDIINRSVWGGIRY